MAAAACADGWAAGAAGCWHAAAATAAAHMNDSESLRIASSLAPGSWPRAAGINAQSASP